MGGPRPIIGRIYINLKIVIMLSSCVKIVDLTCFPWPPPVEFLPKKLLNDITPCLGGGGELRVQGGGKNNNKGGGQ